MILFLRNPEIFTLINNQFYQIKETKIGCKPCPDCKYFGRDFKYKIKECDKHKSH